MAGDVYYLRMLLHHDHCKRKTSFDDLKTIDDIQYESYQEVARMLGLLQDDQEWEEALAEGAVTKMPFALRELFVTITLFCQPAKPLELFNRHYMEWADDFKLKAAKNGIELSESQIKTLVILDLQHRLQSWDKNVNMIGIQMPTEGEVADVSFTHTSTLPVLIREELDFKLDDLEQLLSSENQTSQTHKESCLRT